MQCCACSLTSRLGRSRRKRSWSKRRGYLPPPPLPPGPRPPALICPSPRLLPSITLRWRRLARLERQAARASRARPSPEPKERRSRRLDHPRPPTPPVLESDWTAAALTVAQWIEALAVREVPLSSLVASVQSGVAAARSEVSLARSEVALAGSGVALAGSGVALVRSGVASARNEVAGSGAAGSGVKWRVLRRGGLHRPRPRTLASPALTRTLRRVPLTRHKSLRARAVPPHAPRDPRLPCHRANTPQPLTSPLHLLEVGQ